MDYFTVPSLGHICTINIAAQICNKPCAKKEVFLSNFGDIKLSKWKCKNKSLEDILEALNLPTLLKNKITNIINPMKKQMLTWVSYHNNYLDISLDIITEFLKQNDIIWTGQGNIDKKKMAKLLIKNTNLDIKLSFRIACTYCLENEITHLWILMSEKQKSQINRGQWVRLWIDSLEGKKWNVEMFLENALDETQGMANDVPLIYFMNFLKSKREEIPTGFYDIHDLLKIINCIVNQPWYKERLQINYNIDIICYLFTTMNEQQFIDLYESDKEFLNSYLLFHLLEWPYQRCFMEIIRRMWNYIPYPMFYRLLLKIISKFANIRDFFDRSYDYQLLLKQVWEESPLQFRTYVISNESKVQLISKFEAKCFTSENQEIIMLILKDCNQEEKQEIITSDEGRRICVKLITNEKREFLEAFLNKCLPSKKDITKYKHEFLLSSKQESICLNLVYENQWEVLEKILNWVYTPTLEVNIRKMFIYRVKNSYDLKILIYDDKWEQLEKLLTWCLISIEEIQLFKAIFIYEEGLFIYEHLVNISNWETVDRLINWFLSTEEDTNKSKKYFFSILNRKTSH